MDVLSCHYSVFQCSHKSKCPNIGFILKREETKTCLIIATIQITHIMSYIPRICLIMTTTLRESYEALETRWSQWELSQVGFDIIVYNFVHLIETTLHEHWVKMFRNNLAKTLKIPFLEMQVQGLCLFNNPLNLMHVFSLIVLIRYECLYHGHFKYMLKIFRIVPTNRNPLRRSFQLDSLDVDIV